MHRNMGCRPRGVRAKRSGLLDEPSQGLDGCYGASRHSMPLSGLSGRQRSSPINSQGTVDRSSSMLEILEPSDNAPGGVIRVVIIEDQRRIREGLAALVDGTEGYTCASVFSSMESALATPWHEPPDVVLVDIGLPGMSGTEGLPMLRERYPKAALLMLTVFEDDDSIFKALCAGASGYLLKKTPPAKLLEAIKEAADGGATMSPEIALRVIQIFREIRPPARADAARVAASQAAGGRSQLQDRRSSLRCFGEHNQFSHSEHLRQTASAFEIRSRSESAAAASAGLAASRSCVLIRGNFH